MNKSKHPLYKRWAGMMSRCFNENYIHYVGDRITVVKRWQNFDNYAYDIESNFGLPRSRNDQLLRKDCWKDFSLKNTVGWFTPKEIARNRVNNMEITYKGQTKNLSEWAEIIGLSPRTIWSRINDRGYTPEEALTKQPNKGVRIHRPNK
jgi:hypothetical protein